MHSGSWRNLVVFPPLYKIREQLYLIIQGTQGKGLQRKNIKERPKFIFIYAKVLQGIPSKTKSRQDIIQFKSKLELAT